MDSLNFAVKLKTTEPMQDYVLRIYFEENVVLLGSGAYSAVFEHPENSNIVVKVVKAEDVGFLKFIEWAVNHSYLKAVPVVYATYFMECPAGNYYIVFMERLTPFKSDSTLLNKLFKYVPSLSAQKEQFLQFIQAGQHSSILRALAKSNEVKKKKWLAELVSLFLQTPSWFDFHSGNIMRRGGTLVFSDPLAFENPKEYVSDWFSQYYTN